jgi:hypothetical protein
VKPVDQRLGFLQRRCFPSDANCASDGVFDRLEPERMWVDQDSSTEFVGCAQDDPLAVGGIGLDLVLNGRPFCL